MQPDTRSTLSPDGRWRWDGTQWVPTGAVPPAPAPAPQPISPDGRWRWDGAQWVPVEPAVSQPLPRPAQMEALACRVCGGRPATRVVMRQHMGMVLFWMNRSFSLVCCRDCGLAFFRQKQNLTLLTGWWGVISLVLVNWITILINVGQRSMVTSLPAPVRQPGATPLDPGRPVYLRPGMVVSSALGLAIVIAIVAGIVASSG